MRLASRLLIACLGALSTVPIAAAQTKPAPLDLALASLEELMNIPITTATRTVEGAATAPARVQVVTSAQIQRRGYRSLADVLKDLPDFKVDLAGDWDFPAELTVQGTRGASSVIVLLDGIRVSSPTNDPLPILANYPVHSARQIEIAYGPASALYGADAFSAVINIISKDATDLSGLSVGTSVGTFGLYDQTASYGIRLGANSSLVLSGQWQYDGQPDLSRYYPEDFKGLQAQRAGTFPTIFGPLTPNRYVSPDYDIPMSAHSLQATFRSGGLQLSLFENRSRAPTAAAYTPDNAVYNDAAFRQNDLFVASGTYTRQIGRTTSTSTLTMSRHELDPQSGYWNVFSNMKKSYTYSYGSMVKAEQQVSWKPARGVTATTGGTVEHFYAIPQGSDTNAPIRSHDVPGTILDTNIPDAFVKLRYLNTGAYGQMQYSMTPVVMWTLGARADYSTRYGVTFNPRVGVVAQPLSGTTLKVLYGSAFLAPSPYQAYQHFGAFYSTDGGNTYAASYWHLPNPDLKPQQKKTVEVNLLQALGSRFELSASVFFSRFTNLVQESDPDQSYAGLYHGWPVDYIDFPVNEGRATSYGSTVGLDILQPLGSDGRFAARAALTLADGHEWENDTTLPLGAMAPVQLRFGADVDWRRWSVAPRLAIVGSQRLRATQTVGDSIERRSLPGYATVDVNVRRQTLFKNTDAFVTIENAFDRRYRTINARAYTNPEELIGAPQNPRRLTVGVNLRLNRAR